MKTLYIYVTTSWRMPCGPSASMEMGYARGQEKLTMAHLVTDQLGEVRERLLEYAAVLA